MNFPLRNIKFCQTCANYIMLILPKHISINCRSIFFRYADATMLSFTSYFPSLCMHAHCRSNWWLNHLRKGQHSPKLYPNLILKKYLVFLFTLIFSHESETLSSPLKAWVAPWVASLSFCLNVKLLTSTPGAWGEVGMHATSNH